MTQELAPVVTFFVTRNAVVHRGDENHAMAHVDIYNGESLKEAQDALYAYIDGEVNWLIDNATKDAKQGFPWAAKSFERAAEIAGVLKVAKHLAPAEDKDWDKATVEAAGLEFAIVRNVRPVRQAVAR